MAEIHKQYKNSQMKDNIMKNNTERNNSNKGKNSSEKRSNIENKGKDNNQLKNIRSSVNKKDNKLSAIDQPNELNGYIIPIIFIMAVLPLIVKMKTYDVHLRNFVWFENAQKRDDFFLFYKHWMLVGMTVLMGVILIYKRLKNKISLNFSPVFIPLAVYAIMAILSAAFSKYPYFCFNGSMDQIESLFALLGYCIIVYYSFIFIKSEQHVQLIIKWLLISALIMGALGVSQYLGHDFFATTIGSRIVTSVKYVAAGGKLNFTMAKNQVYLTLFNPNYVGEYTALLLPIFLILLIFSKKIINSILYVIALCGLVICTIGSQSASGMIAITVAIAGILIFMWRYLFKRFYITVPVCILIVAALFVFNYKTDNYLFKRIQSKFNLVKSEKNLTKIVTGADKVSFTYKGNTINITQILENNNTEFRFLITDENNKDITYTYDEALKLFIVQDERFSGFGLNAQQYGNYIGFFVRIEDRDWCFTNQTGDGTYYYLNRYKRWDKIANPPETFLSGYEYIASARGYLWSRTIPLIKDYIFLGSGPDTYTIAFPQNDYVGFYNYGYESNIITKPHCLYLQIAIQTGLVSLIAFISFYAIYFISGIRLYIRGRFNNYYAQVGVAILIGTFAYMITGLANDSSITTAPVFWCLMGLGIVVNKKAKPLIYEEREAIKAARLEKKNLKANGNE